MKNIIIDLDGTITNADTKDYENVGVRKDVVDKLKEYKKNGFNITINTARNMRTYNGEVGKINIHTLPKIIIWLDENEIPYDNVIVGKPWCGFDGFYVDDKAIRPSEFARLSYDEIAKLLEDDLKCL